MLTLKSAQVTKYKSIEDSNQVDIEKDVTVLVGKNESGKTAFLEAIHKASSFTKAKYNPVADYPRKDLFKFQAAKKTANVAVLSYTVGSSLIKKINDEVFNGDKVMPDDFSFTRTSTYDNGTLIGLRLDDAKVLKALKKSLKGIEGADEVFEGADSLEAVVKAIEAKELPADNSLAKFAADWAAKFKGAGNGWGMDDYYVWSKYISKEIPEFLYFDDYNLLPGKVNLAQLEQRKASNTLEPSDETILGLLDLASIELDDIAKDEGYESSKAKLEAIGLSITAQVFEYWTQNRDLEVEFDIKADTQDTAPYNNGKNLYIRIKNRRHGVTVPFDQRSKGFIWFFSFMAWFSAIENRVGANKPLILLLDEPGLNLHALAQNDFLNYIDRLSESHQIIYSTHSPFMVQSKAIERVRTVEDLPKDGTKVSSNLQGSSDESLFPLQAALGYTIAQNLFISKENILVEGPADLILLQHMGSILEQEGLKTLDKGIFVPVGGLDKLATFVALLGAHSLDIVVLHDRAATPHQKLEEMVRQKIVERSRVLDYSIGAKEGNETDIEDLFPEKLYIEAFNLTYAKELKGSKLKAADLGKKPRIIERINTWLGDKGISLKKDGGFNHYRVAQALLQIVTADKLTTDDMSKFEAIFIAINDAFSTVAKKAAA